ncbi:hypothetical protein QAD02_017555 [Eretmocerus hayati]|uniref:Uncharacterized protein n=1 Tax=Eretmocerus hayati TaxID=131215 RepID=A0ACC2PFC8_9HYME|nr:hypothetical protein QAD02_017555 [Eretmocerus hayati]
MSGIPTATLSSRFEMPAVVLTTKSLNNENLTDQVIFSGLMFGYTFIETASYHNNEKLVGNTLRKYFKYGGKREDLFISAKLAWEKHRPSDVPAALKLTLKNLNLTYVDLYVVASPIGLDLTSPKKFDFKTDHLATWKAMEAQVKAGRVRSLGLNDFNITQINNIIRHAKIKPSVLEVEHHVYYQQKQLRKFCDKHRIMMIAFSPFGSAKGRKRWRPEQSEDDFPDPLAHPVIRELANNTCKTPAQVMLRYYLQNGVAVRPLTIKSYHLAENINIFDFHLSNDEMQRLEELDKGNDGAIYLYDHLGKDILEHPQYPWGWRFD